MDSLIQHHRQRYSTYESCSYSDIQLVIQDHIQFIIKDQRVTVNLWFSTIDSYSRWLYTTDSDVQFIVCGVEFIY